MMSDIQSNAATPDGLLQSVTAWFHGHAATSRPLPEAVPEAVDIATARSRNGATQVLVVDDNPGNLGATSELLEQCGIRATLAADGAEAVALCGEIDFDLVLMDIQMPVLSGMAATSSIRCEEAQCARPKAAVVAYGRWELNQGALDTCGFSGKLCKPCSLAQLEACLVKWCPGYAKSDMPLPVSSAEVAA